MSEKLTMSPPAENVEARGSIETEGAGLIDSFAKENGVLAEIIPEQFAERLDMTREENSKIGGALQKFQGKAARMVGMTMLGLSLSWGMPHGTEAAGPGQKIEMREDRYERAEQALQESGLRLASPREGTLSKDMLYLERLIETEKFLASRLHSELLELAVQMGRAERGNKPAGFLFKTQAGNVEQYLTKAEHTKQAAAGFSQERSPYEHIYAQASEVLQKAKQMLQDAERPSERQREIWKMQEVVDKLEQKEKQEKRGLEYRDVELLRELLGKIKRLKEQPQEATPPQSSLQEKMLPQYKERKPEETPAETLERIRKDLQGSRERIEQLTPKVQEEMRKMLTPREKK